VVLAAVSNAPASEWSSPRAMTRASSPKRTYLANTASRVRTTGRPAAITSNATRPKPSLTDRNAKASAAWYHAGISSSGNVPSSAVWWVGGGLELHHGMEVVEGCRRHGGKAADGPVEVDGDKQHEAHEHSGQDARQAATAEDCEMHAEHGERHGGADDRDGDDGGGHSVREAGDSGDAGVEGFVGEAESTTITAGTTRAAARTAGRAHGVARPRRTLPEPLRR
jgi:hypothetical protein